MKPRIGLLGLLAAAAAIGGGPSFAGREIPSAPRPSGPPPKGRRQASGPVLRESGGVLYARRKNPFRGICGYNRVFHPRHVWVRA